MLAKEVCAFFILSLSLKLSMKIGWENLSSEKLCNIPRDIYVISQANFMPRSNDFKSTFFITEQF